MKSLYRYARIPHTVADYNYDGSPIKAYSVMFAGQYIGVVQALEVGGKFGSRGPGVRWEAIGKPSLTYRKRDRAANALREV